VMPRLVGVFMIALGGAVFEFVRARDYSYYRYAFIRSPRRRGRASNRPPGAAADFVTGIKPAYSPALAWPEGGRCPSLASATVRGTATSRQVLRVQGTCRGHAATAESDPNRSRTGSPRLDRLRRPRCSLTASCRYDMLILSLEENGFHGAPQLRGAR
jgi:hypothetical protein